LRLAVGDAWHAAISPDGKWAATVGYADQIWDAATGKLVATLDRPSEATARHARFSPAGRHLAIFGNPGALYEVGTWRKIRDLGEGRGVISPDGKWAARADESGAIHLETLDDGRSLGLLAPLRPETYNQLRLTGDGSRLIGTRVVLGNGLDVWDLRLIGERLAERGLRQDWPAFPPAAPPGKPLKLTIE
jgi:hypothetical protein